MQKKTAFSLIELSVVLAIIGIIIVGISQTKILITKGRLASAQRLTVQSKIDKISDMILWLETSLESSFDNDLDLIDNSKIATWRDHNSNNIIKNNATQTTTSSQPIYISDAINNAIPALRFEGSAYLNFDATALNNSAYTIFIVDQRRSNITNNFLLSTNSTSQPNLVFGYSSDTNLRYSHSAFNTNFTVESYDVNKPTVRIHTLLFNNSDGSRYYLNDSQTADASNGAQTNLLAEINSAAIGTSLPDSSFYSGDISEIIIFNRNLIDHERKRVNNYLTKKYFN